MLGAQGRAKQTNFRKIVKAKKFQNQKKKLKNDEFLWHIQFELEHLCIEISDQLLLCHLYMRVTFCVLHDCDEHLVSFIQVFFWSWFASSGLFKSSQFGLCFSFPSLKCASESLQFRRSRFIITSGTQFYAKTILY